MLPELQVNRDYESVKMLDLGMPAEDVKEENKDDESEDGSESSSSSSEVKENGKIKNEEIEELRSELAEAKEQIARLLELQEAIARQVLSRGTIRSLFDS